MARQLTSDDFSSITILLSAQDSFREGEHATLEDAIRDAVAEIGLRNADAEDLIERAIADIPELESEP